MAAIISISHFAPVTLVYFLLLSTSCFPVFAINITNILSSYPDLSDFINLISTTDVAADLIGRTSITLLAVPNTVLRSSDLANFPNSAPSSTYAGDVIRYHVLLEYLSWRDLRLIPAGGRIVTTLFQTTGRASSNFGSVNITRNPGTGAVTVASPTSSAAVLNLIKTLPYNISVFSVNSLLVPYGFDIMASDSQPYSGLNITKALIDAANFNVAASMLTASGVEDEFERDEGGAGLTLFMPTDQAFSDLPSNLRFQSLTAEKKAVVLRFHVLHSYYPLGSLESIVNPVQPTLATEQNGAGSFTLNIGRVNGSVAIDTGNVQATVIRTVIDQNPVAIFGISKVLLPKEFFPFGLNKPSGGGGGGGGGGFPGGLAQPPVIPLSPGPYGPPSHLSSPPGFAENLTSAASKKVAARILLGLWCIVFHIILWQ